MNKDNDKDKVTTTSGPRLFTVPLVDKSEKNFRNMPTVVFIVKINK
jgi:hypothetical protein